MSANTRRLHRPGLNEARLLWIVLVPTMLLYLIVGLPNLLTYYSLPCEANPSRICTATEIGLRTLGLDWSFFAWYSVLWIAIVCAPLFILCSLLAWRKNNDQQTLLFSVALLVGLVMNVNYDLPDVIVENYPATKIVVFMLAYLGQISLMLFYVFPDGRFVPRWIRWIAAVFAMLTLAAEFVYWWPLPSGGWPSNPINFILWVMFPLSLAYALLYRYQKAANAEQRQQIKWIVWTIVLASILFIADIMIDYADSWFGRETGIPTWYSIYQALVSPTFGYVGALLGPLGFYVAIFRFRLWDVDFFINRSLVYSALAVLLGLVLVGVFTATQALLGILVKGMQTELAGIVSVSVVIALFLPIRDRLQRFVDSRIYGADPNHERAVQAAIAEERSRLSRELHDSVTQSLYGLTIMAESCQRLARDNGESKLREPLIEMGEVARQALKEMRLLIHELRPPVLEDDGLLSALHQRLAAVERRSGIEATLLTNKVVDLPLVMEEALYYIAIEALNNAIKHSEATSVSLFLRTSEIGVELEIADNGKGFDLNSSHRRGGLGLMSMRSRAEHLGGMLSIQSIHQQGTKVIARIDYHIHEDKEQRGGMMETIRVLVADDHHVVRKALCNLIAGEPDMQIVGEAADGLETVQQMRLLQPDVLLLDLEMPVLNGIETIRRIKEGQSGAHILVLTSFGEDKRIFAAVQAGALGYLLKDSSPEQLIQAIRDVHQGEISLPPTIALKLIRELKRSSEQPATKTSLTEREMEVLNQIAQGLTNQEIAKTLGISERTVSNHIRSILGKLHLSNRTQAALYALRQGFANEGNNER